jgi:hypothetical protein
MNQLLKTVLAASALAVKSHALSQVTVNGLGEPRV